MKKIFKTGFIVLVLLGALTILGAPSAAFASGSDAETPYTVTTEGLQLLQDVTFPDNGHVNIRYTTSTGEYTTGIHFESLNNQPSGVFIGVDFLPWKNLIPYQNFCITWVQVSMYNEHFGEGGQEPICQNEPFEPINPTEPVEPTPEPTEPPVELQPEPSTPVEPTSPPVTQESPTEPSTPTTEVTTPQQESTPTKEEQVSTEKLAETGAEDIWWLFILAVLLLIAGASTYLVDKIKKG